MSQRIFSLPLGDIAALRHISATGCSGHAEPSMPNWSCRIGGQKNEFNPHSNHLGVFLYSFREFRGSN